MQVLDLRPQGCYRLRSRVVIEYSLLLEHFLAEVNALIADVDRWTRHESTDLPLRLAAKRTAFSPPSVGHGHSVQNAQ